MISLKNLLKKLETKKDFNEDEILISKLKNTLKSIDINKTAPIEALRILDRLKKENEL